MILVSISTCVVRRRCLRPYVAGKGALVEPAHRIRGQRRSAAAWLEYGDEPSGWLTRACRTE